MLLGLVFAESTEQEQPHRTCRVCNRTPEPTTETDTLTRFGLCHTCFTTTDMSPWYRQRISRWVGQQLQKEIQPQ